MAKLGAIGSSETVKSSSVETSSPSRTTVTVIVTSPRLFGITLPFSITATVLSELSRNISAFVRSASFPSESLPVILIAIPSASAMRI